MRYVKRRGTITKKRLRFLVTSWFLVAPAGVELLNLWNDFRKVVKFIDENPWVKTILTRLQLNKNRGGKQWVPYLDTVTVVSVLATLRPLRCDRTISFLPKRVRVYAFTLTCLKTTTFVVTWTIGNAIRFFMDYTFGSERIVSECCSSTSPRLEFHREKENRHP